MLVAGACAFDTPAIGDALTFAVDGLPSGGPGRAGGWTVGFRHKFLITF